MKSENPSKLLHRIALAEMALVLVVLVFGALTTTKNAGMAFADWPTSDGYFMVTYPWLRDFAKDWDKFLEHGHRLAAMVIGLWSILMAVSAFFLERRSAIRTLGIAILLGVILQGILGGVRVRLDARVLAMLHGILAGIVVSMMGVMIAMTNSKWVTQGTIPAERPLSGLKWSAFACVFLLLAQYVYGGLVRHLGTGLHEHLGLGFLVFIAICVNAYRAEKVGHRWLRNSARMLVVLALLQVLFGLKTWALKYGFPQAGYVAVVDSIQAVSLRTLHMVWGVMLLMTAVVNVLKVYRVAGASQAATAENAVRPDAGSKLLPSGGQS